MKTILPTQSKQKYVLDLLKSQSIIGDTDFVSLSVHQNSLYENNRNENWFKAAKVLEELSNDKRVRVLGDVLKFPITVDQVSMFIQLMADEDWNLGNLSTETDKEKDLFLVIEALIPIYKSLFRQWIEFDNSDLSKISVLDHFYDYPVQQRLDSYVTKGLTKIEINEKSSVKEEIRFASNPRSEVQAALQFILKDEMAYEDQSIVCLDAKIMDQTESFLQKYAIPYQKVGSGQRHPALKCFESIVKFKSEPNLANFINIIHNDVFDVKYKFELIQYLNVFNPSLDKLLSELNHVRDVVQKESALKDIIRTHQFIRFEEHAESALSELRWIISELNENYSDATSYITNCFNVYAKCLDTENEDELSSLYTIKEFLESSQIEIFEGWMDYLLYQLKQLKLNQKSKTGLILTDLKHALIPGIKRQIWLGCTQNNYPQMDTFSGLFDQDYLLKIKGFDLNKRYEYHMKQLNKTRKISDEIIYSFSIGSYDGKAQKMPYELEKELDKVSKSSWELIETEFEEKEEKRVLEPKLAQDLFIKDELKGSISSFETYTHCPYQYFLKYGLGIREEDSYDLNAALLGNITHAFLEHAITLKGKTYALMPEMEIKHLLEPYMSAIKALYPNLNEDIKIMEFKLIETLKHSFEFLKDWEENKEYHPSKFEEKFDEYFPLNNGKRIRLNGKIDRIDETDTSFSVIDYKSSEKKFKESYYMKAVQLQLVTYLWAYSKSGKTATFAGYFSQKPERVDLINKETFVETDERINNRRLNGITVTEDMNFDQALKHIVGWIATKDSFRVHGLSYDFDKVMKQLQVIYTDIYDKMSLGDIQKQNIDKSCEYCSYKHFCQYKGEEIKIKAIKESILKKEKES